MTKMFLFFMLIWPMKILYNMSRWVAKNITSLFVKEGFMALTVHQKEPVPFKLNQLKAIQTVAFLLKQKHKTMTDNYMRLLKLLYIADRESLKEKGRPITGDRFIAMKKGPTLSRLLDLAKQRSYNSSTWDKYIELNGFEITLVQDPGNDKLCRYEVDKLKDIWQRYQGCGEFDVAEITEEFPEWIQNKPEPPQKVNNIALIDVLEALGRQDWFEAIVEDAQDEANFARRFGET